MRIEKIFILLLVASTAVASETEVIPEFTSMYMDVRPVNRSDSFYRIKEAPFVHYKFKYDSKLDRSQMGVIGPDAHKYFPESIDVVPTKLVSSKDRSKPATKLTNFPVIDKNVLFMHGVVALQELIHQYDNITAFINSIEERDSSLKNELQRLYDQLHQDADTQQMLALEIAQNELELAKQQEVLNEAKAREEQQMMEEQLRIEREVMEYEAQLVRERMKQQEELEIRNAQNKIQLEKELLEKKEALARETQLKLQTLQQEQKTELENKRLEFEKEKIRVELEGKAKQELAAHEMEMKRIEMQSQLDTEQLIASIRAISSQLSIILQDLIAKPKQVAIFAGIVLVLITMYYIVKETTKLLRQFIQSRLGRPSLVRETSYNWSFLPHFIVNFFAPREQLASSRKMLEERFDNIILSVDDKQRVLDLALATRNTKQSGAPFRHVLLHGVPGTGKTLIAKRLAKCSGMDYAIMSGGDVAPLGEDAVSQLHGLFRWAESSRCGLLVFIDEAEAFLSTRSSTGGTLMSDGGGSTEVHVRNALNALLYQTGTPSQNFMLVLATNRPEDLDSAVLDRIDVSIAIGLPALPQRVELVRLYLREYVQDIAAQSLLMNWTQRLYLQRRNRKCSVDDQCGEEETLKRIAEAVDGFSGREIAKMFIAAQYSMFLAEGGKLTLPLLLKLVQSKIDDHNLKKTGFKSSGAMDKNLVSLCKEKEITTEKKKQRSKDSNRAKE